MAALPRTRLPASAAYALSAALHVAGFLALLRVDVQRFTRAEDVAVEIVERAPPREEPPPAPAPRVVTRTPLAPPRDAPPAPRHHAEAPPPPSAPPPPDAAPVEEAPVRIGISISSSTEGGSFAAPVGNTLHGEVPRRAPDPAEVKPYRADRYVPPTQITVMPKLVGGCSPPSSEYPSAALGLGIEGVVVLLLSLDETGAVTDASVVEDPGHGFGPAAITTVRRHCKFMPAERAGEKVATRLRFKVRFELP